MQRHFGCQGEKVEYLRYFYELRTESSWHVLASFSTPWKFKTKKNVIFMDSFCHNNNRFCAIGPNSHSFARWTWTDGCGESKVTLKWPSLLLRVARHTTRMSVVHLRDEDEPQKKCDEQHNEQWGIIINSEQTFFFAAAAGDDETIKFSDVFVWQKNVKIHFHAKSSKTPRLLFDLFFFAFALAAL